MNFVAALGQLRQSKRVKFNDDHACMCGSLAKYVVAFLRNTVHLLKGISKFCRSTIQILDHSVAVVLFVMIGPRVLVCHAEAHRVIEQHCNLPGGGSDRFCLANARCQSPIKGTQCSVSPPDGNGCQSKVRCQPVAGLLGVC